MSTDIRYNRVDKFIRQNKDLIRDLNFKLLYLKSYEEFEDDLEQVGILTERFHQVDIIPIEYLDYVPSHYMQSFEGEKLIIPNNVKVIRASAFEDSFLDSVYIPDSVTQIGAEAFSFCTMLTTVRLSNNITRIPPKCFDYCNQLENITIPKSVTDIERGAFNESGIQQVHLYDTIQYLGDRCFYTHAENLDIFYDGHSKEFKDLHKQPNWTDLDSINVTIHCKDGSFSGDELT